MLKVFGERGGGGGAGRERRKGERRKGGGGGGEDGLKPQPGLGLGSVALGDRMIRLGFGCRALRVMGCKCSCRSRVGLGFRV